ncbi:GSCFA domain-containing protein [Dysgonomonas sp. Marseille-P4677]|uniref:GSCFA domain-containing protein n=1 Tax=Dysgonomonas sp. Marseille-P4677 TaxID=2364790 RepID=UPI0019117312|nr:GSCFA domain-containing protein [Dysgonomonas sp. Marseille-P4677]MBK5721350.1 GSCFA domain-containing protein [Dysgonomonas sp. Marseille-P4677]
MDFRTKIEIPKSDLIISHKSRIMMLGSCFAENIGELLIKNKFDLNLNPFGILYNPKSISQALAFLCENKKFSDEDIFEYKGSYHSFWHHGAFSNTDKNKCLTNINNSIQKAAEDLRQADILFVTFGTAFVFLNKDNNTVVGNCHKLPASFFDRQRLDVNSIIKDWEILINTLQSINPKLQIILTVSPIRHMKDGAHENQLSKSTLLLAIDNLKKSHNQVDYFPSYEIVLDELRDYRFYNEDMIHPNSTAINYIWKRFSETYIKEDTYPIIEEWNKIYLALNHRPINIESDEYKLFLRQTLLKLKAFNHKYPYICCNREISDLETRLS